MLTFVILGIIMKEKQGGDFMPKELQIEKRFSHEVNDIENILRDLENGRYYEHSGARMDGYLSTNISHLREKIHTLLYRIENDQSFGEEIAFKLKESENK